MSLPPNQAEFEVVLSLPENSAEGFALKAGETVLLRRFQGEGAFQLGGPESGALLREKTDLICTFFLSRILSVPFHRRLYFL